MDTSRYTIQLSVPPLATYSALRDSTGLSAFSPAAATISLKNSLFAVQILLDNSTVVGMGRVIGDGGCFFQVTDIAVHPEHQGQGLGRMIMSEIRKWLDENVPKTGYVSLIADGTASKLYEEFGFVKTRPMSEGMALVY